MVVYICVMTIGETRKQDKSAISRYYFSTSLQISQRD